MMTVLRKAALAAALAVSLTASALAAGPDVNATITGLALRGVDPVSYFTSGRPEPGSIQITAKHEGADYRFASEANRDLFLKDPAKYLPQYGGFCAFGTAKGYKVDGDPAVWKIVEGKLYLNYAPEVNAMWSKAPAQFIGEADANWTKIKDKDPAEVAP